MRGWPRRRKLGDPMLRLTLCDRSSAWRTRAFPPICSANLVAEVAADATPNGVICAGSGDGSAAGSWMCLYPAGQGLAQLG